MLVLFARSSSTGPFALPSPDTRIVQVVPPSLVLGVPIEPPVVVTKGSVKLLAVTLVTASLKVAWKVTLVAFVNWPLGEKRLMELSVGATWSSV